jgi:hypothetical protein
MLASAWDAALMLQEFRKQGTLSSVPDGKSRPWRIALLDEAVTPFVGNGTWVTSLRAAGGYKLNFERDTDVPEETALSDPETETASGLDRSGRWLRLMSRQPLG